MLVVGKSCKWENVVLVWFFNYKLFVLWVVYRCIFVCGYIGWFWIFVNKFVNRNNKDGFINFFKGSFIFDFFFKIIEI